jgi:hypothetical protein
VESSDWWRNCFQFNLIQLNPSRGARQTRLRRAAIGGEFIFNLIKSNFFKLLYNIA